MTDKNRDLVEELLTRAHPSNVDVTDRAAARIQTLSVEIERLRGALGDLLLYAAPNTLGSLPVFNRARAALAGDSHD